MSRKMALSAGAMALLLSSPVLAHHPSGATSTGGAGPIGTISATTLDQGQGAAALFFEMVKIDAFTDAQLKTFAGKHIHAHSLDAILAPTLVYAYGVTKDFTIIGRVPVILREDIREGHHSHGPAGNTVDERGDAAGIGDVTLLGQYRFYNNRSSQTEMAVLLGIKIPTGRSNLTDSFGERFETEFQPGTGSWDGLLGLAYTQRFGAWSLGANVLYQLSTTGAQATDMGDRFLYNAAVSYRLFGAGLAQAGRMNAGGPLPEPMYHGGPKGKAHHHQEPPAPRGPALDVVLELNGEWHGQQVIDGAKDPNSGGNVVYLSPGLRYSLDRWSAFASIGIPIVNQVYGIQAEPDWRLLTGVAVNF
jgi:Putative MetA-pathway of phenol degradation